MGNEAPRWQTGDGRLIPVTEMVDEHLRNAIIQIEKKATGDRARTIDYGRAQLKLCSSEFGRELVMKALQDVISQVPDPEGFNSMYGALIAERERRIHAGEYEPGYDYRKWWD